MAKQADDYSSKSYWDKRYVSEDLAGHEWYFEYDTLRPLLATLLPKTMGDEWAVLEIGCGDVPLLPKLVEDPHFDGARAIGIDFAPSAVRKVRLRERERRRKQRGTVAYEQADARSLSFNAMSFDLCLDKGTIDAMMCSDEEGRSNVRSICEEASRVLRPGGAFVIVSHMNPTADEGMCFLQECLFPALLEDSAVFAFEVGVHFDDAAQETGPFVYAVSKIERRMTRSVVRGEIHTDIPLRLHSY